MSEPRIFLSPPHMSGGELDLVRQAFESNYIAPLGPMVDAFEEEFAAYIGVKHCLALSSGTAAMHLALRHLGIGEGDIVLASSFTFVGSVSPAVFLGADLRFIDSCPNTWNMDPIRLEEAIEDCRSKGRLPKAVIPTDLYGQCADYDAIHAICDPLGIPVVIDSAEALGATYKGRPAGKGGRAAVFSFNGNKIITTSGGGMLASDDKELMDHARKLSTQAREDFPHYEHVEIGYNYRMSNILAAIGRGQLRVLDERITRKKAVFNFYQSELGGLPGIAFMPIAEYGDPNYWLTCILVDPAGAGVSHEEVRLALESENIESRPLWKPMHMQPVFKGFTAYGEAVSEGLFGNGLCLPSGSAMSEDDLNRVCNGIRACGGGYENPSKES